jgi:Transposase DDE domain group 1
VKAPSQPTLSRLGRVLAEDENREVLREGLLEAVARRVKASRQGHRLRYASIDVDGLPIDVHGQQPGSEYNEHYHARIYHPIVASLAETGDLVDVRLREGHVHSAEGALEPDAVARARAAGRRAHPRARPAGDARHWQDSGEAVARALV